MKKYISILALVAILVPQLSLARTVIKPPVKCVPQTITKIMQDPVLLAKISSLNHQLASLQAENNDLKKPIVAANQSISIATGELSQKFYYQGTVTIHPVTFTNKSDKPVTITGISYHFIVDSAFSKEKTTIGNYGQTEAPAEFNPDGTMDYILVMPIIVNPNSTVGTYINMWGDGQNYISIDKVTTVEPNVFFNTPILSM